MHPTRLISKSLVILLFMLFVPVHGAFGAQVQLVWNQVNEPGVTGYKVYYGTSSRNYSNALDVKDNLTCLITALSDSRPYYFAVTSYTPAGESVYSDELIWQAGAILSASSKGQAMNLMSLLLEDK